MFNIGIKKISKCIEKYFAFTFLVSVKQLYADEALYLIEKKDKLNIFYRLKVIGFKTEMSRGAVRRGAARKLIFFLNFFFIFSILRNIY